MRCGHRSSMSDNGLSLKKGAKVNHSRSQMNGAADRTKLKSILIKFGISNVPVDCFHIGGYRYANLEDAVAQAKRMAEADE